jgi:hypothetical protein
MEESEIPARVAPTDAQNAAAFAGPAPGINRFVATLGPSGLRIAFMEEDITLAPHFRAAVTMHPQDGVRLYKMLQDLLKELEAALAQMEAASNGSKK